MQSYCFFWSLANIYSNFMVKFTIFMKFVVILHWKKRNIMKIVLLQVGKTVNVELQNLIAEYEKRLKHYTKFEMTVIPDLKNTSNMSFDDQKSREGELLLKQVSPSDRLILLDEHGSEYRSVDFARQLNKWLNSGRDVFFAIGGPYGFSRAVYDRSDGMLSLSQMTFSHQMIRLLFVEQLYRAFTILHNEPYHHE